MFGGLELLLFGALLGTGAAFLANKQAPSLAGPLAASERANQAALDSLALSEKRLKDASDALRPAADSENARLAAERRQRRLGSIPSTLFGGALDLAEPAVGYRTLMGQ